MSRANRCHRNRVRGRSPKSSTTRLSLTPHSPTRELLPDQKAQTLPPMDKELQKTTRSLTGRSKVMRLIAGPVVALAVCALLLDFLNGLSRGLDYHAVTHALRATPRSLIWISILLTAVSYLAVVASQTSPLPNRPDHSATAARGLIELTRE